MAEGVDLGVDFDGAVVESDEDFVEVTESEEAGPPIPCDSLTLLSITADLSKVMNLSRRCQEVTEVDLASMDNVGLMGPDC